MTDTGELEQLLAKATPGEWRAIGRAFNSGHEYVSRLVDDDGREVLAGSQLRPDGISVGTAKANAKLAALAPQLASEVIALREALRTIAEQTDTECDFDAFDARQVARAALAGTGGK